MQFFDAGAQQGFTALMAMITALGARGLQRLAVELPHCFLALGNRFFWGYLLSFVLLGLYAHRRYYRPTAPRQSLRGVLAFLFPPATYRHPSALIDYQLVLTSHLLGPASLLGGLLFGSASIATVAHATQDGLVALFGAPSRAAHWSLASSAAFALGTTVARDLVTFLTHVLHHRVPLLWEFHKVHHSAEVLTPVTVFRKHPVYNAFEHGMVILLIGPLQGAIALAFVGQATAVTLWGANIVFTLFHLAGANLRHSHIWLPFGRRLSHVVISPAQHQIHHSKAEHHQNKNFGEVFALWDWLAGTLYVAGRAREALEFGVADGARTEHATLWRIYIQPFVNCLALSRRAARRPRGYTLPALTVRRR